MKKSWYDKVRHPVIKTIYIDTILNGPGNKILLKCYWNSIYKVSVGNSRYFPLNAFVSFAHKKIKVSTERLSYIVWIIKVSLKLKSKLVLYKQLIHCNNHFKQL